MADAVAVNFNQDDMDRDNLRYIFPTELWCKIVNGKSLADAENCTNMTQACSLLGDCLEPETIWRLFNINIWQVPGYQQIPTRTGNVLLNNTDRILVVSATRWDNAEMESFLADHGGQIRYCTIGISAIITSQVDCYRKLWKILTKLPNLRGLHVHYGPPLYAPLAEEEQPTGPTTENLRNTNWWYVRNPSINEYGLQNEMRLNPLPPLPDLRILGFTDLPDFLTQALRSAYGPQVATIDEQNNPEIPFPVNRGEMDFVERRRNWDWDRDRFNMMGRIDEFFQPHIYRR